MRGAIEKLVSPPDYAGAAFTNAVILENAADEYAARKEATIAEMLYKEALGAMRVLQGQRADWQAKIVSCRIISLDRKVRMLGSSAQSGLNPLPALPGNKPSASNDPVPDGWRPFEFNGQTDYVVPLSSASAAPHQP